MVLARERKNFGKVGRQYERMLLIFSFNLADLHAHLITRLQQEPISSLPHLRAALLAKPVSQHKASNSCTVILPALVTWGRDPGHSHPQSSRFPCAHRRCPEEHWDGVTGYKHAVFTLCKHAGLSPPHPDEVRDPHRATTSVPSRPWRGAAATRWAEAAQSPPPAASAPLPCCVSGPRGNPSLPCPAPLRPYLRGRCPSLIPGEALAHPPSERQRDTGAAPGPAAASPPGTAPSARGGRGFAPRRIGARRAAGVSIAVTADSASRGPPGAGPSPDPALPEGRGFPEAREGRMLGSLAARVG